MKKLLAILLLLICLDTHAQRHQLPDQQRIIRVLMNQKEAWNRGDLVEYMQGYWQSDSLIFIGKKGINRGWSPTLKSYQETYSNKAAMGTLTFDIISVELITKTTAHVVGKWDLRTYKNEKMGGYFTLIFKKMNGRWLIVLDHTS